MPDVVGHSKPKYMKILLLFACFVFNLSGYCQKEEIVLPQKDGKVVFDEIVVVDSINKYELFKRAKLWIINSFKSEKQVITTDDKELGILKGSGIFSILTNQKVRFTFEISVKDSKYKYAFYDFDYLNDYGNTSGINLEYYYDYYKSGKKMGIGRVKKYMLETKAYALFLSEEIKAAMKKAVADW